MKTAGKLLLQLVIRRYEHNRFLVRMMLSEYFELKLLLQSTMPDGTIRYKVLLV